MDKISGIIPNSARVTSVDMRDTSPVRPGTPTFGRPEIAKPAAVQSPASVEMPSALQRTAGMSPTQNIPLSQMTAKAKDEKQAAIATELTSKFFMKNDNPVAEVQPRNYEPSFAQSQMMSNPVASKPTGFKTDGVGSFRSMGPHMESVAEMAEEEPVKLQQPEGLYPRGSFLDRSV